MGILSLSLLEQFLFWNICFIQWSFDLIEINTLATKPKFEICNTVLSFSNISMARKTLGLTYLTFKSNFVKQFTRQEKYLLCFLRSVWICCRAVMSIPGRGKIQVWNCIFIFYFIEIDSLGQRPFNLCFHCAGHIFSHSCHRNYDLENIYMEIHCHWIHQSFFLAILKVRLKTINRSTEFQAIHSVCAF